MIQIMYLILNKAYLLNEHNYSSNSLNLHKLYFQKELYNKTIKLVQQKYWLASFIIILLWSYYVFILKNKFKIYKEENQSQAVLATKHALFGFIVTLCGYLDMTIWVYWLTWIMSFYLEGWV